MMTTDMVLVCLLLQACFPREPGFYARYSCLLHNAPFLWLLLMNFFLNGKQFQ